MLIKNVFTQVFWILEKSINEAPPLTPPLNQTIIGEKLIQPESVYKITSFSNLLKYLYIAVRSCWFICKCAAGPL